MTTSPFSRVSRSVAEERSNIVSVDHFGDALRGKRLTVLSGAGLSTESGIPDYRGPGTLERARKPMTFQDFVADAQGRRRYWARSTIGWPRLRDRQPNDGHYAINQLKERGVVCGVITQNVDRLHHKAGTKDAIELHGALADVVCLSCSASSSRDELQNRLMGGNPNWRVDSAIQAPDGDADVNEDAVSRFQVVDCLRCDGPLKPDVVFFGESVKPDTLAQAWESFDKSEALLVIGSSLTVYSGFRFVRKAEQQDKPVYILNLGETRGDDLAEAICHAKTGSAIPQLVRKLL